MANIAFFEKGQKVDLKNYSLVRLPLVSEKAEEWGHSDHIFEHVKEKNMTRNSHYGSRVNHVWATLLE